MTLLTRIVGHEDKLDFLLQSYKKGLFPHGWLLYGRKGIGKHSTLINFLSMIFKDRKINKQNIFTVNSEDNLAFIEEIRNLISQINLTNSNSSLNKTFVVIDNSELLNFNSLNALLKTIEEPPENTIIIIICHNIKQLPKTIISRCIKLRFNDLKIQDFCRFLKNSNYNFSSEKVGEIYEICNGSPGLYETLISKSGKLIWDLTSEILTKKFLSFEKFEALYNEVSKNYNLYFQIIINCLFRYIKKNSFENFNNIKNLEKNFLIFNNIKSLIEGNVKIDKKKELHYLFSEYLNLFSTND